MGIESMAIINPVQIKHLQQYQYNFGFKLRRIPETKINNQNNNNENGENDDDDINNLEGGSSSLIDEIGEDTDDNNNKNGEKEGNEDDDDINDEDFEDKDKIEIKEE